MSKPFTKHDFRTALGSFATGVTIVTAWDAVAEVPVGVTASSFNSVSLDPPLILWSIGRKALSARVFQESERFSVHVLTIDQADLANRFAKSGTDKYADLDWREGTDRVPHLPDVSTRFDCVREAVHEGGDHWIVVGRVEGFERGEGEPLVFENGDFAGAVPLHVAAKFRAGE